MFNLDINFGVSEEAIDLPADKIAFLENTAIASGLTVEDAAELEIAISEGLNEAAAPARTIIRLSKIDKLKGLTMTSALTLAQQKKDPLYAKFAKFARLRFQLKQQILKKYRGQATVTAREILRNVGKRQNSPADMGAPAKDTV